MNKKGMEMSKKILNLLYRSFDEDLDEREKKQLDEALENSEELRKEKEQIIAQRKAVSTSAAQSFGPFFAERVMNRIQSEGEKENALETFYESLKLVFRRFVIVGTIVIIALISYNLFKVDSVPMDELYYASDITAEEVLQLPLF